ncbi:MAG: hypothetical protein AB8F95_18540 [Bacteroidia bacterium]
MKSNHQNHILHLSIPNLPVAVERLHDKRLHHKPVVVGGFSGRSLVDSCSAEARAFGVRPGTRLSMAQKLCPEAIVLLPDPSRYQEHTEAVHQVLVKRAPVLEPVSAADYFVDMSGMERFFGYEKWTRETQHQLRRDSGLQAAAGRSVNKLVSELASARTPPDRQKEVAAPEVPRFIAPIAIRSLPLLQARTAQQLSLMGVRDVATLRLLDPRLLTEVFGQVEGQLLRQFAQGEDNRKVAPPPAQKVLRVSHRFGGDTADVSYVKHSLRQLAEKLASQLRLRQNTCKCLHLRIEYADFGRVHRKKQLAHPNAHTRVIAQRSEALFKQIPLRRVVIRSIILEADFQGSGSFQPSLFPSKDELLDRVRDRGMGSGL